MKFVDNTLRVLLLPIFFMGGVGLLLLLYLIQGLLDSPPSRPSVLPVSRSSTPSTLPLPSGPTGASPAQPARRLVQTVKRPVTSRACAHSTLPSLDQRYRRILRRIQRKHRYGRGGLEVLRVAWQTLRQGRRRGRWLEVGLEDLWTHALQEGRSLFRRPGKMWKPTRAAQTHDMLGQTTLGPWQITLRNIRRLYGRPYGVKAHWSFARIARYCAKRPRVQAAMIADYIQRSYRDYGRRGPYAIQRYFWLEGYVRGWIGQARWDLSVLPRRPAGGWRALTPRMKANTGFYAKQILLGTPRHPYGLLYWLWISRDYPAIRATLQRWKHQHMMRWSRRLRRPIPTRQIATFDIQSTDLKHIQKKLPGLFRVLACHKSENLRMDVTNTE